MLQGCEIDEGLKGGTRLADGLAGAVEAVLTAAADHSQDVAGLGIDGDNGALRLSQTIFIGIVVRQVVKGLDSGMLLVDVESRVNLQTFFVEGVVTVFLSNLLGYVIDEGCIFIAFLSLVVLRKVEILVLGLFGFRGGDVAILDHLVEDDVGPLFSFIQVIERRVVVRALGKAGQEGTLGQGQFTDVFIKVCLGSRLDSVGALAEVNLVHVHFEDFFFTVLLFDF